MRPLAVGGALLLSTLALSGRAPADEVFLVGGGRIVGDVVERNAQTIVIEVGAGRVALPASRVARVASGTSALSVYRERAARLHPQDAPGWLALGLWARDQDLITLAGDAFERVVAIDPGNEAAHRALSHVRLDGQWMTEAESYRARGYVQYEGEWMTPEQAQVTAGQRMAEAEARRAERDAAAREREAEARAAAAEAEAARAAAEAEAASGGIPYPWVFGPGYGPYGGAYVGGGPVKRRDFRDRGRDPHRGGNRSSAPSRRPPRDNARSSGSSRPRTDTRGVGGSK
jgi:hypothetical protein